MRFASIYFFFVILYYCYNEKVVIVEIANLYSQCQLQHQWKVQVDFCQISAIYKHDTSKCFDITKYSEKTLKIFMFMSVLDEPSRGSFNFTPTYLLYHLRRIYYPENYQSYNSCFTLLLNVVQLVSIFKSMNCFY